MNYQGKKLGGAKVVLVGQLCVAKPFRGKGLVPKMYNFWSTILLGTMSYEGQPFPHHMKLGINEKHFERWQALFMQTVKDNFSGATADMAMERAKNIATIFQYKLGLKPTEI